MILARWNHLNPHQVGAQVPDILDMLDNGDSDLDVIEAVPDDQWPHTPPLSGLAARAMLWGRPFGAKRELDLNAMAELLYLAGLR